MRQSLLILALIIALASCQPISAWKRILSYGCTDEKIEIKDKIGQCKCQDGSQCVWTDNKPIMGCPCTSAVKNPSQQKCLKQAEKNKCGSTKFECSTNFGSCTCVDNTQCVWAGEKDIMGCPCGSGTGFKSGPNVKMPGQQPKKPSRTHKIDDL